MADTDFYNLNLYRRYPLVDERFVFTPAGVSAVDSLVVDFGIVLLPDSEFDPENAEHRVYLSGYGLSGGLPVLQLAIYAPGAAIDGLTQTINFAAGDMRFASFQLDSNYGYGFAINGLQTSFGEVETLNSVASGIAATPDAYAWVERRCVVTLKNHFVSRVVVANEPRTTADCQLSSSAALSPDDYRIAPGGEGLTGNIVFMEGYNCRIDTVVRSNGIRFSATRGAGLGEACEEIPRTAEEVQRKADGYALDCAVRCHETITSINGVTPSPTGAFYIRGGTGIAITSSGSTVDISTRAAADNCHNPVVGNSSSSSSSH